jgi:CDP-4-dehydro-6-deoxyglucose reductase, E1
MGEKMKYSLASSSWDDKEINAAIDVIKSGNCTMGAKVKEFEEKFAKMFGSKYAVMSNSGSSANLLAIAALMYRKNGAKLNRGDEVIVPAVSWSTTYYPLHQYGLKMKFVDINKDTLNMSIEALERAITKDTKAIFAVNLLGNPNDFDRLKSLCAEHNIILIEDNCESMFATYNNKHCGTFGVMGTYSTFFSHHLCTIEGGVTVTDDEELYQIMISLRAHGWTRGLPDKNFVHDKDGEPFNDLFRFVLPGYNLRPNEVFAAIGVHQLDKLPSLVHTRRKNAYSFLDGVSNNKKVRNNIRTQTFHTKSDPSWFGFSMVLVGEFTDRRKELVKLLTDAGIECRPIVAGSFVKNPVMKHMECEVFEGLPNAEYIDRNGLFVGNTGINLENEIDYLISTLNKF